jgi:ubiquitin carboxyl-terminal hydrolase 5/13
MGIPENPATWSLYKTGNNNADMAVTWYFENMADESINQPLRIKKEGGPSASIGDNIPAESLMMMTSMGFPEIKCIKALKNCDMNVERATDWLFSHMDDPDSEVEVDGDSVMSPVE